MAETEKRNVVLDHNYDGIQEYDNPLPGWWNFLFVGSVAFSLLYVLFYEADIPDRSVYADYDRAVAENLRLQFGDMGELELTGQNIGQYMQDEKWLKVGEIVFKTNCVSCHGVNAGGVVGPNLTDDNWKHVRNLEDLGLVIRNGAAGQAMPAWKNRLHPNELVLVSSYVASLRGTNAPGKGEEGPKIPPWDIPAAADSDAAGEEAEADTGESTEIQEAAEGEEPKNAEASAEESPPAEGEQASEADSPQTEASP